MKVCWNVCVTTFRMYVLVEFTDEKCLAVIPDKWRDGTKCALWPSWKVSSKITKAAMKKMEPQDDWQSFPIRELYEHGKLC